MTEFYRDGLKFQCTACGECCRYPGGQVEISREEAERIAAHLGTSFTTFLAEYVVPLDGRLLLAENERNGCVFLDAGDRCRVYPVRPVQCRTFPFWPENLPSRQRWESLKRDCPGIGKGENHAAAVILRIRDRQAAHDQRLAEEAHSRRRPEKERIP